LHGFGKELEVGDYQNLTKVFPGATPRAIRERVVKFKREHRQAWEDMEKLPSAPVVMPAKRAPRGSKSSGGRKPFSYRGDIDDDTEASPMSKTPKGENVKAPKPRFHSGGRKTPTLDGTGRPGIEYEIDELGNVTFDEPTPNLSKCKADARSLEPQFTTSELDKVSNPGLNLRYSVRTPTKLPPIGLFPANGSSHFSGSNKRRSTAFKSAAEPEKNHLVSDEEERVLASPAITLHRHKRPKLEHSPSNANSSSKVHSMIPKLAPPRSPILERAASLTPAKKLRPETQVVKPRRSFVGEPTVELEATI